MRYYLENQYHKIMPYYLIIHQIVLFDSQNFILINSKARVLHLPTKIILNQDDIFHSKEISNCHKVNLIKGLRYREL